MRISRLESDNAAIRYPPLAVRNHSPTGPAWGYDGSGPAQLALAILLAVTDAATAERFYQRFKWDVIAPFEADRWALDTGEVLGWLQSAAGTDEVVRLAVEERAAAAGSAGVSGTSGDGGGGVPGLPD